MDTSTIVNVSLAEDSFPVQVQIWSMRTTYRRSFVVKPVLHSVVGKWLAVLTVPTAQVAAI